MSEINTEILIRSINERKSKNLFITSLVGSFIIAFYIFLNILLKDYPAAIYEAICLIIIVYCTREFLRGNRVDLAKNLVSVVLLSLAIHNFNTGGFYLTGLFWVFVLTSIIFYVKSKYLVTWILLLHISILGLIFLHELGIKPLNYIDSTIITFYITLFVISIFTYLYNQTIDQSIQILRKKSYELEDALLDLSLEETKTLSFKNEIEEKEEEIKYISKFLKPRRSNVSSSKKS